MRTHNIGFYEDLTKIITYHQISSNTHLISSAAKHRTYTDIIQQGHCILTWYAMSQYLVKLRELGTSWGHGCNDLVDE